MTISSMSNVQHIGDLASQLITAANDSHDIDGMQKSACLVALQQLEHFDWTKFAVDGTSAVSQRNTFN